MTISKKILAVATSQNPKLGNKHTGLWLSELTHFLHTVDLAGYAVDIASPEGKSIPLDQGSVQPAQRKDPANVAFMERENFASALERPLSCAQVEVGDYAAIYLAGGHGTMWDFRQSASLQRLMTAFYDRGRYVTGVCHGVAGFVDAVDSAGKRLVADRRVTGFSNLEDTLGGTKKLMPFLLEDALKANGARYRKNLLPFTERVEVDGQLITGQNPQSARAVARALLRALFPSR